MPGRIFYWLSVSLITVSILFSSCWETRDISNRNLADYYRNTEHFFHPEFAVHHTSATASTVLVKLDPKEFLFVRQADDRFKAMLSLHYDLMESYETTAIRDSATFEFEIFKEDTHALKLYTLPFRLPDTAEYLLSVTIHDIQKKFQEPYYVKVDNRSRQSRQSFSVQAKYDSVMLFKNFISDKDSIKIFYRDSSVQKLFVKYYHRDFPLAYPPFSFDVHEDFDYTPDSIFQYSIASGNYITLPGEGFYHFQIDTSDKEGLTLFRFSNSFPAVTTPQQMIETVRYLITKREYEDLKSNPNTKAAIEKLWIDFGSNSDRTRMLIKKYYTRVQEANKYFSSFQEGWRTDRGMVYIVFGRPTNVYKSSLTESWTYGQPGNALSLNFLFTKVLNPFTDNDLSLNRSPIYEGFWYRAVDVWRQGRAYNDN
jgi:GWxTD domain-containing protein